MRGLALFLLHKSHHSGNDKGYGADKDEVVACALLNEGGCELAEVAVTCDVLKGRILDNEQDQGYHAGDYNEIHKF